MTNLPIPIHSMDNSLKINNNNQKARNRSNLFFFPFPQVKVVNFYWTIK